MTKGLFSIILIALMLSACVPTVQVPYYQTPVKEQTKLPWPDEPVYKLPELTKGKTGADKLKIVLDANKATIDNLENTIKETGRVEDPPKN